MTARTVWGILCAILLATSAAISQPDSLWSHTFGGSNSDVCYSVQQTTDGGYILGGGTTFYGTSYEDIWLVKTNVSGTEEWSRTFGGSGWDWCHSVQQTSDGGYILGGRTNSYGAGDEDIWLVKTDANGIEEWSRTFGGSNWDECYSVQQTTDGGYILGGYTSSYGAGSDDFWLVKTDVNGTEEWSRTFGGSSADYCKSVQQTTDSGYILAGTTCSFGVGNGDFWLVKTDAGGTEEWSHTFGGSNFDECKSVQQTTDGGYILGGGTMSYGAGSNDFWLVKTDVSGTEEWSRTFGGSNNDVCSSVQQTTDSGYILGGWTESYGAGDADFWLVKTDTSGTEEWSCTFGGSDDDYCLSVQQTTDGGYILGGWTHSFGAGDWDFWLVKTGPELATEPLENPLPDKYTLHQNYPNPFNPSTQISFDLTKANHVSLKVFDLLGRKVVTLVDDVQSVGSHSVVFDGSGLPSGIYLCRLQAGNFTTTKKMVLLK